MRERLDKKIHSELRRMQTISDSEDRKEDQKKAVYGALILALVSYIVITIRYDMKIGLLCAIFFVIYAGVIYFNYDDIWGIRSAIMISALALIGWIVYYFIEWLKDWLNPNKIE